jgi:F-type H+-transporting ATPase subunit b
VLIDWFTVAAQIVNFLILVALMKRFLYGPLVRGIDAREERIAVQRAEVGRKNLEAELKSTQVQKEISELECRGAQMMEEARKDANRQRNELVQTARESVQALEAKWRDDLRREESAFFSEVRRTAATEIFAITRHALADLASVDIERSAIQVFLEKLRSVDAAKLKTLCAGGGLTVVSATGLAAELRHQIEETIEKRIESPVPVRFELAPEIAWGIELRGNGQRIGWTPDGYLDSLEEKLKAVLDEHAELGCPVAVG